MLTRSSVLNPANTSGPPPLPSSTGTQTPPATTPTSSSTLYTGNQPPKSGWTPASKAGLGIGIALIIVALTGGLYFFLRWTRKENSGDRERPAKPKMVWNVGPIWARKVRNQMLMGNQRGPSPQELEAEGNVNLGVKSPGVSEASTISQYGRSRVGSWGGELDGSVTPGMVVRGHL
jgi:hypothetical protein